MKQLLVAYLLISGACSDLMRGVAGARHHQHGSDDDRHGAEGSGSGLTSDPQRHLTGSCPATCSMSSSSFGVTCDQVVDAEGQYCAWLEVERDCDCDGCECDGGLSNHDDLFVDDDDDDGGDWYATFVFV